MVKNCIRCGNIFKTFPSRIDKGLGKYCGLLCSNHDKGAKKGVYRAKGHKHTEEYKKRMSLLKKGEKNPMWKGDKKIHFTSIHEWVNQNINKPKICKICGSDKNIDLANKNGKYIRDFHEWEYLCRRCHMEKDGRMNNLKPFKKYENVQR